MEVELPVAGLGRGANRCAQVDDAHAVLRHQGDPAVRELVAQLQTFGFQLQLGQEGSELRQVDLHLCSRRCRKMDADEIRPGGLAAPARLEGDRRRGLDRDDLVVRASETPIERSLARLHAGAIGPDLGASYPGKGGEKVVWKQVDLGLPEFDVGPIHIAGFLEPPSKSVAGWSDKAVAYLYRRVECDRPMDLRSRCGSDDGIRLWWNGELLVDVGAPRALNPSSNALELHLEPGVNHLLVKVANGDGNWAFQIGPQPRALVQQTAINQAIDRGIERLFLTQLLDGSWAEHPEYLAGATGYAAYCLLECGVPPDHPAIERARAYVLAHSPAKTYAAACELLFLCELGRPADRDAIEERVDTLLGFQVSGGLFSYPESINVHGRGDLSLTLYAALGLRAAAKIGHRVPDEAWTGLITGTLSNFEGIQASQVSTGEGAGFRYHPDSAPSGSMTTAGITVLAVARDALGGVAPPRYRKDIETATSAALRWLQGKMNWGENPAAGANHHYFWLYGVERVGGLLGLTELGGVEWYPEGAYFLLGEQQSNGSWGSTVQTILALLFLERVTVPTTGDVQGAKAKRRVWSTAGEEPPFGKDEAFRLEARIGRQVRVWIESMSYDVRGRLAWPAEHGGGLRVVRIEYVAQRPTGGAPHVIGAIECDPGQPITDIELAVEGEVPERGEWNVVGHLIAQPPPGADGALPGEIELRSVPLRLRVHEIHDPVPLAYAEEGTRDLLDGAELELFASSSAGDQGPARALDGLHGTAWMCAPEDATPVLRLRSTRAIRAGRLALSHGNPRLEAESSARVSRVRVILDEKERFEVLMDPDPLHKSYLDFGGDRRPKTIEIQVLELSSARLGFASVGFAEIELLSGE